MADKLQQLKNLEKTLSESGYKEKIKENPNTICASTKNCKKISKEYHADCELSKISATDNFLNRENTDKLPHKLRKAIDDVSKCKRGRINYAIKCCDGYSDLGHIARINKLHELEEIFVNELKNLQIQMEKEKKRKEEEEEHIKREKQREVSKLTEERRKYEEEKKKTKQEMAKAAKITKKQEEQERKRREEEEMREIERMREEIERRIARPREQEQREIKQQTEAYSQNLEKYINDTVDASKIRLAKQADIKQRLLSVSKNILSREKPVLERRVFLIEETVKFMITMHEKGFEDNIENAYALRHFFKENGIFNEKILDVYISILFY